jgi:ABC-type sugar transport system substrate-binding protein
MKRSTLGTVAALAASALALTGCTATGGDDGTDDETFRVAAFSAGYASPAIKYVVDNFQAQAEAEGWEVELFTTNDDYDGLNTYVQTATSQDFDAFFLAGFDPRALGVGIAAANEAEIPVFAIDGDPQPNEQFTLDVISDQQSLSDISVGLLDEALGGLDGKNVLMVEFDPALSISARAAISREQIEAAGGTIVDTFKVTNISASVDTVLAYVKDYLQAHPGGLDGVWAGWAPAGIGAFQAVAESGADVKVVSADTMGAINEIVAGGGPFVGAAMQDWDTALAELIAGINEYRDSGAVASNYIAVPGISIDPSNAATVEVGY